MDELTRAEACADALYGADNASRSLGMDIEVPAPGRAVARMTVTAAMLNGHGSCHGGYIFTLADSAFAFACNAYDKVCVAAAASIDFIRPVKQGERLTAEAREHERRGRTGLYDVDVYNDAGERVALFRGRCVATGASVLADAPCQSDTD